MHTEKMYAIAVRKRENSNDYFWEHDDFVFHEFRIKCDSRYWLADPFVIEKNGKTYIFYEAFDRITKKGKIGYSVFKSHNDIANVKIVINEPYHLSFPNVFNHRGHIYIMPETCERRTVQLYKAIDFPKKWKLDRVLLNDIFSCDTILAEDSIDKYLITSEMYHSEAEMPVDNFQSCWVKNVRYKLSSELMVKDKGALIAEGDYGIRNGGACFDKDGEYFRVGQDCVKRQYGRGIVIFKVEKIKPYQEKEYYSIDFQKFKNHIIRYTNNELLGVHTYNTSEHYEVIDYSYMYKLRPMIRFARKFYSRYQKLIQRYRNTKKILGVKYRNRVNSLRFKR